MDVRIEESWKKVLEKEFEKDYFKQLVEFLKKEYQSKDIRPKDGDIFRAFNETPFSQVRVVILGQDPYPTPGHAHGLSFSVDATVNPLPKSLINIYKEIQSDLGKPSVTHGDLSTWAQQGVFLLNTALTVVAGKPNSHQNIGWEEFTDESIRQISMKKEGIVFILWGSNAQKKIPLIDQKKHVILKSVHPSPLSAYRGFFGCKHFSKTNEWLMNKGEDIINW